jgi:hypothetical protein
MKKRLFSLLLSLLIISSYVIVYADVSGYENEQNDSRETANIIELNKTYTGNLYNEDDEDYYKFVLDEPGKISINFKHDKVSYSSWSIYLIDSDYKEWTYFKPGGSDVSKDSVNVRLPAGEYYIKIIPYSWNDSDYRFIVNYEAEGADYEKENNPSIETANNIELNKTYTGNLYNEDDEDYYKFVLDEPGKISINFKHDKVSYSSWSIYLIDSDYKEWTYFKPGGSDVSKDSVNVRLPAGEYYIKIIPYSWNNSDYQFMVKYKLFNDLDETHWAYQQINQMVNNKILNGYPDGTFRPNTNITREQFAKLICEVFDLDLNTVEYSVAFTDVESTRWSYDYIRVARNYLTGYILPNGKASYRPTYNATREDVAVALVKALNLDVDNIDADSVLNNKFKDASKISPNLRKYIAVAVENNLITGFPDGTFRPDAPLTRAQAATLIFRVQKDTVTE